ncbi:hypothetical protein H5410_025701 [Solanum commersonii]|uniref:Uncharacterized protein n=1 Tax=Solanum commersonii TaxID=4109 RepID=A0A9J5YUI0_SOLCO|nr:hypothetical protein H5410_025701 [Solanum commersonii]
MISAYALQEDLDEVVRNIPHFEKLFIARNFNDHIVSITSDFDSVHQGLDFGVRSGGAASLLDFAKVVELVITNSCFPKEKEDHLITFIARGLCKERKTILSGNLTIQHKQVMDMGIKMEGKKKTLYDQLRIKSGSSGDSKHFPVKMRLHQGSTLSLYLFAFVMNKLTWHIKGEEPWFLLFAYDIVLIKETRKELTANCRCRDKIFEV